MSGEGRLHLAAGDGTSATFLTSVPGDLSSKEVTMVGQTPRNHYHDREVRKEMEAKGGSDKILGSSSRDGVTRLPPAGHKGSSSPDRDSFPGSMPHGECPDFTLMSPDEDSDTDTSDYMLECRVTSVGVVYEVTYTYREAGSYHMVAYFQDQPPGSTKWRWRTQVSVREVLEVVLGEC